MKIRKVIVAFLAAICILASVCTFGIFAEGTSQVYAETSASVQQGEYGYCYVYLDDLTDLASLNVAVHYDTQKVTVTDSYNQVACSLYDSSNQNGCLQYSYIFDGEGSNTKTNLFYFCYQVNENAEIGNTCFDIVVTDAYNTSIESVDISGSRCNFTITEKAVAKTAYVYGSSDMETSVKEEFEISYSLDDWQIASGSMVISYDPELFEFVEIANGAFLDGKLVDVNANLDGSVYLSFLATEYNYSNDLFKVKFRTLKNVTESSVIKLTVSELYDLDRNRIVCDSYTTNVAITHDATYAEDSPSMSLSASYDAQTDKVTVTVLLEKDSHLGAGDFVLNFDTNYLTYSSVTKGFAPSFFNINDKNVDEGILKFSIISLSDITDGQPVLTVVFDTKRPCQDTLVDFEISGSGLADSLTNPILLNFVDANVTVPLEHTDGNDNNHLCDKGCGTIADDGCYDDNTDHACDECGATGMGPHSDGADNNHLCDYGCGQIADDGCHDVNTDDDHKCDECDADNVTAHTDGTDNDHLCDNGCGFIADDGCYDNDKNHKCDECKTAYKFEEHKDTNKDHSCDYGCSVAIGNHTDGTDDDHLCDYCSGGVGEECYDENTDHACDECGATGIGEHADGADADHLCDHGCGQIADDGCHDVNTDKDHKCDECEAENVTAHTDGTDNDHLCDNGCGKIADDGCYDDNTDHACDECGVAGMGDHSDGNDNNHLCDYGCGQIADDGCHDVGTDADHKCDECGKDNVTVCEDSGKDHICDTDSACVKFSTSANTHADGNDTNHTCDYCGGIVDGDVCVDTNPKNHICDECGTTLSECDEGETVDGKCDYCGNPVDHAHVDTNKDHECDYDDCTAIVESHTDTAPKDHKCDSYGDACIADKVAFGEHSDGDDADHLCDYGCGQVADEGCHGGTATCAAQAVCVECGNSYGTLGDHAYGELIEATEAVHTQTELTGAVAAHYFCDVCDKYFTETKDETTLEALTGEAPIHTPNADDGDCTTAISCSVCGKITTPANVSHTGGTATCEKKAECTVCGKEYGDPKGHSYSFEWSKDDTHHWHECSCGDKTDETEHSYGEWTVTKEATTTEKGGKTKSCICGHSLTEEIPAKGTQSGNEDEENSNEGNLITEPDVDNGGLSGGAITGIAIGTVAVASIGGFSLFWFAIKKKSWADLFKVFKK